MSWNAHVLQLVLFSLAALLALAYGLTVDEPVTRYAVVGGAVLMLAGTVRVVLRDARRDRD